MTCLIPEYDYPVAGAEAVSAWSTSADGTASSGRTVLVACGLCRYAVGSVSAAVYKEAFNIPATAATAGSRDAV